MKKIKNQIKKTVSEIVEAKANGWEIKRSEKDLDNFLERRLGALGLDELDLVEFSM